ncbi:MAG: helix-turn-helix domain-containing protein [Legionella sp.]|nr:MAG: helix-turn-helix domain-containing protein [Legionella sp.]
MAKHIKKINSPDFTQNLNAELLGQAIKARRTQSELRIEDAAALCGVAKQTLMKIEHGNPSAELDSILQICTGLGIKLRIVPWMNKDEVVDEWQ